MEKGNINMKTIFGIIIGFFMVGCSLNPLPPKKYSNYAIVESYSSNALDDLSFKDIYILDFKSDVADFSDSLYSNMNNIYFNGKKYFNTQRRDDLSLIYNYYSNKKNVAIHGNKYLIDGKVLVADFYTDEKIKNKLDYENCLKYNKNGECELYPSFDEICTDYNYKLVVKIMLRDIVLSKIVYDKYYEDSNVISVCNKVGSKKELPILSTNLSGLSASLAKKFVKDLTPQKKLIKVPLMEKNDIYYSEEEHNLLKNSLSIFEKDKIKSRLLFEELVNSTNSYSSTALYNLGVLYEFNKDYKIAKQYYSKALNVASTQENMNENIINSLKRVEKTIELTELLK